MPVYFKYLTRSQNGIVVYNITLLNGSDDRLDLDHIVGIFRFVTHI